jgi:AcrR family transcriptional regulator
MAKGRSRRGGERPTTDDRPDADRIIDATLARIAQDGWRRLSLAAIAAEAGLPILRVYRTFSSKHAILRSLFRRVDQMVLTAPLEAEPDERPRDRVFDILMRRLDALQPYKPALEVLRRELPSDPVATLALGAGLLRSMAWMLEAAAISTTGVRGAIAVKLTAAAYLSVQRTWLRDESPDLASTMAVLDRRLRGIERWLVSERQPGLGEASAPT